MRWLLRRVAYGAWAILIVATFASAAWADRRVALVIGNANYDNADTLLNTISDSRAIAALFRRAGFDVVDERINVGVVEFKRAVRNFLDTTADADIAVVYYSGHGIEVAGVNYLVPVDAKMENILDADDEAVSLDRILLSTQTAKKLSLIILDACRENPFLTAKGHLSGTRSIETRLIGITPTSGDTLIAYAAKAGSLSYDGTGPNSPFTAALVKYIAQPGLDIRIALGKVRDDVLASTGNRQEPFVYGSLGGANVSLVPAIPSPSEPTVAHEAVNVDPSLSAATDYALAERVASASGWHAFLEVHQSGYYADLARAQLAKLTADRSNSGVGPELPPTNGSFPQANPSHENEMALANHGSRERPHKEVAEGPPGGPSSAGPTGQNCERDQGRLWQLRSNPSVQEVTEFARNLECESLRPEVLRLMESLGLLAVDNSARGDRSTPQSQLSTSDMHAQVCKKDESQLAELRAHPSPEKIQYFARTLACEDLRPQLKLLMESFGFSDTAPVQAPSPISRSPLVVRAGPSLTSTANVTSPRVDFAAGTGNGAEICRKEAVELTRIRSNPDRNSVQRFTRNMKCDALKAQAARLLESVGD